MACRIINCFFKFLFSIILILIALKGFCEVNNNKGFVSQNLRLLGEKLNFEKLIELRGYSALIIMIENYLLILTACLLLFNSSISKLSGFLAVMIELILVHNPVFYGENIHRGLASQYLGILGGILLF